MKKATSQTYNENSAKKVSFNPMVTIYTMLGATSVINKASVTSPQSIARRLSDDALDTPQHKSYLLPSQVADLKEMLLFNDYDRKECGRVMRVNSFC